MDKHLSANISAQKLALLLLICGMFYGCTKDDSMMQNPKEESTPEKLTTAMDSLPHFTRPDSLPMAQMITLSGFELADVTMYFGWPNGHLVDPDSIRDIANNNRHKEVIIKTAGRPYNLISLGYFPYQFHEARDTLIAIINYLNANGKGVSGRGTIYTERHDLPNVYEILPGENYFGMSVEDYEWFTNLGYRVVDTTPYKNVSQPSKKQTPRAQQSGNSEPVISDKGAKRPIQYPNSPALVRFNNAKANARNRQMRLRQKVI